jgi:predicted phosphodiesterase
MAETESRRRLTFIVVRSLFACVRGASMYQNPPFGQNPAFGQAPQPVPAQPGAPVDETLIIHHISDLHRSRTAAGRGALDAYAQRLQYVPAEQQPQVIIITGDLTLAGHRDELRDVAGEIRHLARRWDDLARRQRVFVVPGPHDIDWAAASDRSPSLEAFVQEFYSFCIPVLPGPGGRLLTSAEPYAQPGNERYLIYLVNTCYTPETLPQPMPKPLDELVKRYRALWKERAKAITRPQGQTDEQSSRQFLKATEELIVQDRGVVRNDDVNRFLSTLPGIRVDDTTFAASYPADEQAGLLKILVTHHPLIAFTGRSGRSYAAAQDAGALVKAARRFNFQLALHGHAHEPHILTDQTIDPVGLSGGDVPLRQVGAGTLSGGPLDSPTFNELVAVRNRTTGRWTLNYAPINLLSFDPARKPAYYAFPLYNTAGMAAPAPVRQDDPAATTRAKFEGSLRVALRMLAEEVENDSVQDIPARPLATVKEAIKEIVFAGIETRIGLALVQRQMDGSQVLANKYILPDIQVDDQYIHPFTYPDTVAAWALIMGEPIIYPTQVRDVMTPVNYDWLHRSGKYEAVLRALREAAQRNPGNQRLNDLRTKLENGTLTMNDIFQPWPTGVPQTRFVSFISVPVPLRTTAGYAPRLRELGALNVDIIDPDPAHPGATFTPERVDMLRTLAYLIDTILTTAYKLRRPRDIWQNPGF